MKILSAFALLTGLPVSTVLAANVAGEQAFARGDYDKAYRISLDAAEKGDPDGMEAVGMMYDTGHGVPQDFGMAFRWYLKAAKAGSARAAFDVGVLYDSGRGVPKQPTIAINWYKMAADRGYGRAAYNLGTIYRDGDGVPRDVAASVQYFRMAEKAGVKAASQNLALLDRSRQISSGIKPNAAKETAKFDQGNFDRFQSKALERVDVDVAAAETFTTMLPAVTKDAIQGNQLAQYNLGFAYEHGIGVSKDITKSYVYYMLASFGKNDERAKSAALKGSIDVGVRLNSAEYQAALTMLLAYMDNPRR